MKYSFFTLLAIATYLAVQGAINISFDSITLRLSNASAISVTSIILLITLFTYWTINEGNPKARIAWKKIYRIHIEQYMKTNKASLLDNLLDKHPGHINESEDVYYHDGELLLKTANASINGVIKYPGYALAISKTKYALLFAIGNLKAFFDFHVMPYVALPLYGEVIALILLAQLLHHHNLL